MPYNTRRKSLSLVELGVVAPPKRSRAESQPSHAIGPDQEPHLKRAKRSHGDRPSQYLMSIRVKSEKQQTAGAELSPPLSPLAMTSHTVDIDGINDDIVVAVIRQLELRANRPLLVRQLAQVLATNIPAVAKSTNPSALIASRLTSYINRPWPAMSPCPLAKDLSLVHPRRLYFYLTTLPRQPLPVDAEPLCKPSTISPSLSSSSGVEDESSEGRRSREVMSPSPEIELCTPQLDDDNEEDISAPPTAYFSARSSVNSLSRSSSMSHHRVGSPPLEREEHDFRQTANKCHERAQLARNLRRLEPDIALVDGTEPFLPPAEPDDMYKHDFDATLFGQPESHRPMLPLSMSNPCSPILVPQSTFSPCRGNRGSQLPKDLFNLESPENIEVEDLETMFDDY
ncbi:hypothetical protein K470DRAFT_254638 [Piedraia hortae CBS 480.64]|uniref:GDS1 winged helix domain-containing protein n=1 Tax=Piedraia hortae CBS 480.64 TaxID=1314780 RepID=A0A6A7C9S0_9PEZI|nr:hypothetical protein K470DRAFT_254638 [Piedraia hortae CBS 480.64]